MTIRKTDFNLVQCHWHSPSEHTVNGTRFVVFIFNEHFQLQTHIKWYLHDIWHYYRYDLELHMVHTSARGRTAVIGVLYKLGEPNEFLTKVSYLDYC